MILSLKCSIGLPQSRAWCFLCFRTGTRHVILVAERRLFTFSVQIYFCWPKLNQIKFYCYVADKMSTYSIFNQHVVLSFLAVLFFKAGQLKAALVEFQVTELKPGACCILSCLADPSTYITRHGKEQTLVEGLLETGSIRERRGRKKTECGGNRLVGQGDWVWLWTTDELRAWWEEWGWVYNRKQEQLGWKQQRVSKEPQKEQKCKKPVGIRNVQSHHVFFLRDFCVIYIQSR